MCWLLAALVFHAQAADSDAPLQELLQVLDNKQVYFKQRTDRIAALTRQFRTHRASDNTRFALGLRIYQEYQSFKYDSAFVYAQRLLQLATQLKNPREIEVAKLNLAFVHISSGMFKEAFDLLETIDPAPLDSANRAELYFTQARAYSDLLDYDATAYYTARYRVRSMAAADSALSYCRPGSYDFLAVQGFKLLKTGQLAQCRAVYQRILRLPGLTQHQVAVNASSAAYVAELEKRPEAELRLLIQAAIADIKSATTETLALFKLSSLCYDRGDLKNSYAFIKSAREDATFYNARLRQMQINTIFSVIEGQKIDIIEQQRQSLTVYAVVTTALILLSIAFAAIIFRQLRKLQRAEAVISAANATLQANNEHLSELNEQFQAANRQLNEANQKLNEANALKDEVNLKLHEANAIKDEYIVYYFNTSSEYIDKLEAIKSALGRSLASKQYVGSQRLIDDIDIRNERNELFKGFDQVFLKLFPNFVADFNALLREEEQIHLPAEQLLNAELRIFALIRLGIDDGERLSKMLGYTVNTIYTYKARTKKKSVYPSEEFETLVRGIKAT